MIPADATLDEIREFFENDRFASGTCGFRIVEAAPHHAVCEADVSEALLNEKGGVMGGAIFTLADFAMAVASNVGDDPTVSVSCSIDFMSPCRGERLISTARTTKDGRTLGFYEADVTDELGTPVARVTGTSMHLHPGK